MSTSNDQTFGIIQYDRNRELLDATRRDGVPRMAIYPLDETCIVLGRGSDPELEVHLVRAKADSIPLYRRPGGGCTVVLDPGNVVVSVMLKVPGLGETKKWFNRCTDWMVNALAEMGIAGIHSDGISDLVIGDRKIAGSAVYRSKDIFYYAVTLLVTADLTLIDRYLPHPPREPEYRAGRSHLDFLTTLRDASGINDQATFTEKLKLTLKLSDLLESAETTIPGS